MHLPREPIGAPLRRRHGTQLSYIEGGYGPPLVLVHGIPGSARTWLPVAERLAGSYRVVLPDLAGFGDSSAVPGGFRMEIQASLLGGLLLERGFTDPILAGHDFGGPVIISMLRLYPEIRPRALVISSANLFPDTPVPLPLKAASLPTVGRAFFHGMVGTSVGVRLVHAMATRQRQALPWREFRRHLTPGSLRLTPQIFQHAICQLATVYAPVEEMLAKITCPALILWGARDPFFPVGVGER